MSARHNTISRNPSRNDLLIEDYFDQKRLHGLHGIDPKVKLPALIVAVALNVIIARFTVSFPLLILALGLAVWSRIPFKLFALFFLAPAWATMMVFLGFSAGFGETPVWSLGPITFYREGFLMGINAATRILSEMSWMAVFFLTTPFPQVLDALRWIKVPNVLVDVIALAYRYAFLLMDEFHDMRDAARHRGGLRGVKETYKTTAMILSQILLRAYDRSMNIQNAMIARGANGTKVDPELQDFGPEHSHSCPNKCDITPEYEKDNVPILSCENLSFSYDGIPVIQDLSLSVERGDVVFLCGPNGAGKTTFIKLLTGLLMPDKGTVRICDIELTKKTRNNMFRYAGFLSQDSNEQLFGTNVFEDIAYGPRNLGLDEDEVRRLTLTAMELTSVKHLSNRPIHRLSHGEMKRVGLAGLIAMQPPLIFLDEPTAGLDPSSKSRFVELISHLNSHHGYTFVIVTHDIDVAASFAKRIVVLKHGQILADGSIRDILSDTHILQSANLEPPILTQLFHKLHVAFPGGMKTPITLEEAVHAFSNVMNRE